MGSVAKNILATFHSSMERPGDCADNAGAVRTVLDNHLDGRPADQGRGKAGSDGRLVRKTKADLRRLDRNRKALFMERLPFFNVE
jgi:hypothetical protein